MSIRDLFVDVLHTLWGNKLRTFLTMFGIAWGIVSIVLMVGAGEGFRQGNEKMQQTFGRDIMIVFAGRTSMQAGGTRAGHRVFFDRDDPLYVQSLAPACKYVMPEVGNEAAVHSNFNNAHPIVTGSYPEFTDIRSIALAEGRFYNWTDVREARRVAFLGTEIKKQLFPFGKSIGENIYINGIPYVVIGSMEGKKQNSSYDGFDVNKVFIPFTAMQEDLPNKPPATHTSVDRLLVSPRTVTDHEACKHQVRVALGTRHGFDPLDKEAAGIWDTLEDAKAFAKMTEGMKYFLGAVGITTLFLGGIGVMNVMLVAVRERTREIGVRKAVGAPAHSILRQFFLETLIIVLLSGGGGLAVAYSFCALINMLPMPDFFIGFVPTWQSGVLSASLLGLVAVLAALYPASKAATIDPIEALRFEAGG
jgi:putative ABC transport system permease protein